MTRVHATLRLPSTMPLPVLLALIRDVEAAGFDGVGILDSQLLCRDTFVTLGPAAVNTSRLMLFPAVTNPFTRHVSVLASAVQSVEDLAPGRTKVVGAHDRTEAGDAGGDAGVHHRAAGAPRGTGDRLRDDVGAPGVCLGTAHSGFDGGVRVEGDRAGG